MENINLGRGDLGRASVTVDDSTAEIDLWDVWYRLGEFAAEGGPGGSGDRDYLLKVAGLMAELGLGEVTVAVAGAFHDAVTSRVEALKKKEPDGGSSSPGSPASTASTPSG